MSKKTLVMGASTNPTRYSFLAVERLKEYDHQVVPFGIKKGEIHGYQIVNDLLPHKDIDTVSLYLSAKWQEQYYDYIISLAPKRIIFNPGTENPVLFKLAKENGIEAIEACTLVMLSVGNY